MKFDRKFLENNSSIMKLDLFAKYGLYHLKRKTKSPHLRGPIVEILVFSVVTWEGFEPKTFGL